MRGGQADSALEQLRLYARAAPAYSAYVRLLSLGAFPSLYREGRDRLRLAPGATVLDMCCGTGELFPYLQEAVGSTGRIIGCDISGDMLAGAQRRIDHYDWTNVTLVQADARRFTPPFTPDAAIFCLCLSAIPSREAVFDRVLGFLPIGSPVVVIDSLTLEPTPQHLFTNFYARAKALVVGADPDCGLAPIVASRLDYFATETYCGGIYSLMSGTRPPQQS